jgi:diadenylate cyclase
MTWNFIERAWRPALEILILTIGIYYAFRFVRGTRGAAVVTGFLVVFLTFVMVTSLLKLEVLQWISGAFSAFFAIAVVVLFQPELRRMLAELGNLPVFATAHEQRENIKSSFKPSNASPTSVSARSSRSNNPSSCAKRSNRASR